MQDPNEDTEWNDILRKKGIIGPKQKEPEITEEQIQAMIDDTIRQKMGGKLKEEMDLDELDELEDDEDEEMMRQLREKRIAELKEQASKDKFGMVLEISGQDYVEQVNKAGDGVWVVLHLYKQGIPLCALLNQHITSLANKFKSTKFIKSISTTCVPNFPDRNLPTMFVYFEGDLKKQIVGANSFGGMNCSVADLEWILHQAGAVPSKLTEDPRKRNHIPDAMDSAIRQTRYDGSDSDD
jgi:hypothetical protein